MNKCSWVLGLAAVATLAGCRDENYDRKHLRPSQYEPTPIVSAQPQPGVQIEPVAPTQPMRGPIDGPRVQQGPIIIESVAAPSCSCPPGTKHPGPCTCGAPDCKCQVAGPGVKPLPPPHHAGPRLYVEGHNGLPKLPPHHAGPRGPHGVPGRHPAVAGQQPVAGPQVAGQPSVAGQQPAVAGATPEYTTYIVQRGDYLGKISKKFNIKMEAIRKLNPQIKKDIVRLGQKIKLPGKVEVGEQQVPAGSFARGDLRPTTSRRPAPVVEGGAKGGVAPVKAPAAQSAPSKTAPAKAPAAVLPPAKKEYKPYTGATKEYVVKSGDIIGRIAYANGLSIRQFKELNGLTTDSLSIGQKLKVPAVKPTAAQSAEKPAAEQTQPAETAPVAQPAVKPAAQSAEKPAAQPAQPAEKPAVEAQPAETPAVEQPAQPANEQAQPAEKAAVLRTHKVKEGEDLAQIAIDYSCSLAALRELNNLNDGEQPVVGQILKIPATGL